MKCAKWQDSRGECDLRLQLDTYRVADIVAGSKTALEGEVLSIDLGELRASILQDRRYSDVRIDIVRPGESARIHNVVDVVEPRARVSSPGSDFPGMLSAPATVGDGRTCRLAGMAVFVAAEPIPGEPRYWREAIVDMEGPGAAYSPFSQLVNLVLTLTPSLTTLRPGESDGRTDEPYNQFLGTAGVIEFNEAVRKAGLKTAVYLASTAVSQATSTQHIYELSRPRSGGLPRVAYMYQGLPYVYGVTPSPGSAGPGQLPTLIHPNEVLDGAVTSSWLGPACHRDVTYLIQNHAVIEELYAAEGQSTEFAGTVIYTRGDDAEHKERMAEYAVKLARMLDVEGAILTYLGSGQSIVDVMMINDRLQDIGVQTTVILPEMAASAGDSGVMYLGEHAEAIVSAGNYEEEVDLPPVASVLGGAEMSDTSDPADGPLRITLRSMLGSTDPFGGFVLRGVTY